MYKVERVADEYYTVVLLQSEREYETILTTSLCLFGPMHSRIKS